VNHEALPSDSGAAPLHCLGRAEKGPQSFADLSSAAGHERSSIPAELSPRSNQVTEYRRDRDYGGAVTIAACGRTFQVDGQSANTIQQLQHALQRELSMHGQDFELMDVNGMRIDADSDLRDAVAQGRMPLVAALHEASIHYIENRREELSQMQWKLLRDQLSGLGDKVAQLGRRVHEVTEALGDQKQKQDTMNQRLLQECGTTLESSKEFTRHTQAQLTERMDALMHLIHTERNVREASKHGLESQINACRDMLEGDKSTRRAEIGSHSSMIDEMKKMVIDDQRIREDAELRYNNAISRINDRIDALSRVQADSVQDLAEQLKQVEFRRINELHDPTQHIINVSQKAETSELEVKARCQQVEDKTASLENRLQEFMHRQSIHIEDLRSHKDKITQSLENVRMEERGRGLAMRNVIGRMGDLEDRQSKDRSPGRSPLDDGEQTSRTARTSDNMLTREEVERMEQNTARREKSPSRMPYGLRSRSQTPTAASTPHLSMAVPAGMVAVPLPLAAKRSTSPPPHVVVAGVRSPVVPVPVPGLALSGGRSPAIHVWHQHTPTRKVEPISK
jgi:hypothetical protein